MRHPSRLLVGATASLSTALLLAAATPASAASTVDVSTLGSSVSSGWVIVSASQSAGGNFTAGLSGTLDTLEVTAQTIGTPTNLTASIYLVDGSGFPTGSALATTAVNFSGLPANPAYANLTIPFSSPASITQGTRYAFLLSSTNASGNAFGLKYTSPAVSGIRLFSGGPGSWVDMNLSPLFATYVTTPASTVAESIPLQQFAVSPGTRAEDCAAQAGSVDLWAGLAGLEARGWSLSYAMWPHGGTGGWVCSRQPLRQGGGWTFS
jgi:hypothetical protein